jgi:hypothetical protein
VALRSIFKDHAGPFSRVRAAHGETQEEPKSGPVSSDGVRGLQYVGRETGPGIRLKRGGQPRHERLPKSPAQRAAEDAIRELRDCCALDGLFAKIDAVQVGGQWYLKVMPDELARHGQHFPHGSADWKASYGMRSVIEGFNGYVKDPTDENIDNAARRRGQDGAPFPPLPRHPGPTQARHSRHPSSRAENQHLHNPEKDRRLRPPKKRAVPHLMPQTTPPFR